MDINYILRNNVDAHLLNTSDVKIFPEVLIGIDHYNDVINTSEPSITLPSGLLAVPTFFGHVITGMGNADASSKNWLTSNAFLSLAQPEHENFDLSAMWALENFGITDPISESDENQEILQNFYDTIEIRDKEIFVKFSWKMNRMDFSDNYKVSFTNYIILTQK
ncbi:hypothetical protein OSTOST_20765 [Ostertagia ostertagi]